MKKKIILSLGLIVIIVASVTLGAYAASDIKLLINGKQIKSDIVTVNGSNYVPLRMVGEALGADVKWDAPTRTIIINSGPVEELPTEGVYAAEGLTFYDVTVEEGTYGWDINAEVKNTSGKDVDAALFTATFYGSDGKRIGTASGSSSELKASETKTTTLITSDDLSGWKTIKFQIDMSY